MRTWTDDETKPFTTGWRSARVERVVDGDTFDLVIDLGFDVAAVTRIRLMGEKLLTTGKLDEAVVDAWETRGKERTKGMMAKLRAQELLIAARDVRIFSRKGGSRGKYGRWLAVVLVPVEGGWQSIGDILIAEGHADDHL